jgi:hypothetical protein
MDETLTDDIPQVSIEKNDLLTADYSEEEVRKAIFQMEHNKSISSRRAIFWHAICRCDHAVNIYHALPQIFPHRRR